MTRILTVAAMALVARLCAAQATSDCRLYLADQEGWSNNVGFYVDLEATTASDGFCHLDTLTMFTGVADGKSWCYPSFVPTPARSGPYGKRPWGR